MDELCGKTVFVTGSTGLIGQGIVNTILAYNQKAAMPVNVIALVRNRSKAEHIFPKAENIRYIESSIERLEPKEMGIEYIIHGASVTASRDFVNQPVETILTALDGTRRILELARVNPVKSLVFLSSMEVYGTPGTDEKVFETNPTNIDTMLVRSCYSESKRMCENMCVSYGKEYGVPSKVIRLTQTFGRGVQYHDGRVFAEFARCVIENRDIVLHTKGETKRSYLSVSDAVEAVFTVLLKGKNGEAYNAANESTYCSIYEMAEMAAKELADEKISVKIEDSEDIGKFGYAAVMKMNLDTNKLQMLGWRPKQNLHDMFFELISDMKKSRK